MRAPGHLREKVEELAARLREGETHLSLARTLAPLFKRVVEVVGEEELTEQKHLYVRLPDKVHDELSMLTFARGESLNSFIAKAVVCLLKANPLPEAGLMRRGQLSGEPLRCCPEG